MKIITTQKYRNWELVEQKRQQMEKDHIQSITLEVYQMDIEDYFVLPDNHHTYEAAKQLNLTINYKILNEDNPVYKDWSVNEWDYMNIDTGEHVFEQPQITKLNW
jgi:hypothetical protein